MGKIIFFVVKFNKKYNKRFVLMIMIIFKRNNDFNCCFIMFVMFIVNNKYIVIEIKMFIFSIIENKSNVLRKSYLLIFLFLINKFKRIIDKSKINLIICFFF